jgi:hypothetical protein
MSGSFCVNCYLGGRKAKRIGKKQLILAFHLFEIE